MAYLLEGPPFLDGGPYHIETCPLICRANQWIFFGIIIGTYVMKDFRQSVLDLLS